VTLPALYRFYAAEMSYFSGKVRPAFQFKAIHYVELLPDFVNVIIPRTGLSFIPVVITPDDETLQDTSEILDELERRFPTPALHPATPVQRVSALLWELYADEFLVLPAMHYRWSFPESEAKARAEFAACSPEPERAVSFANRMKGTLPFLGVTTETVPAIEAHTRDLLERLSTHLEVHPYLFGTRPSLADCALLGPLYAHLYMDAVPGRLLRETAPLVCRWIERMNHLDPSTPGEWLADDALAPTLRPLLELIGRDAAPVILDTVRAFESWADTRPTGQDEPMRAVGTHDTRLRGIAMTRYTSSYTLWMVQRSLDAHRALAADERAKVDATLAGTGLESLLAYEPRHRLGKRRFKLVFKKS